MTDDPLTKLRLSKDVALTGASHLYWDAKELFYLLRLDNESFFQKALLRFENRAISHSIADSSFRDRAVAHVEPESIVVIRPSHDDPFIEKTEDRSKVTLDSFCEVKEQPSEALHPSPRPDGGALSSE